MRTIILLLLCYILTAQKDTSKTYYEDNILKSICFNQGKKIHKITYFKNGNIKRKVLLNKDSVPLSIVEWNENGEEVVVQSKTKCILYDRQYNSIMSCPIKNGLPNGKAKSYENGVLTYEVFFKNGLAEGNATGYDPVTKEIIAKEVYSNNKLTGEGEYFNRGGMLSRKIFYNDGCPYKAQTFSPKGEIVYETTDKNVIDQRFRSTASCQ